MTNTKKYVTDALGSGEISREGYEAMRAFGQWHIGAAAWANDFLDAYLNPKETLEDLEDAGMDIERFLR